MAGLYGAVATFLAPLWSVLACLHYRVRGRIWQRFSGACPRAPSAGVWLHGSSAGDINALLPIAGHLRRQGHALTLSARTPSGQSYFEAHGFPSGGATFIRAPLDHPWAVWRALSRIRPRLLVLEGLELWPSLLIACERAAVKVAIVNGRLSAASLARYALLPALFRPRFRALAAVMVASESQRKRFLQAGVAPERVLLAGNSKYARLEIAVRATERRPSGYVFGSFRVAEEGPISEVIAALCRSDRGAAIVAVPRHCARAAAFRERLRALGIDACLESEGGGAAVAILDSFGGLARAYTGATVAFVGGSLSAHGGHNVLEAAACGVSVVTGPMVDNCRGELEALVAAGAAHICAGSAEVAATMKEWAEFSEPRAKAATRVAERFAVSGRAVADAIAALLEVQDGTL